MEEQISRGDLLKAAGIAAGGTAALGLLTPSVAHAQVPHSTYIQAYVTGAGLPPLFVQGSALEVPTVGTGTIQRLPEPGIGFDVDFGQAVAARGKNKGRNTSWCLLTFTRGGYNGFPPVTQGDVDAIRLKGTVTEAADPANLGLRVRLGVSSGAPIDGHHPICLVKFFFGSFGPWTGRGLAIVNM